MIRKLNYANVVATIAIFTALGGGAYAASVAKNSVKSNSIKNSAVRSVDVKDGSVTGLDVNEGTLGQVPSAASADAAQTAQSAQTADSATSAQTAETAANAANADTLNGRNVAGIITKVQPGSTNPDPDIELGPTAQTVAAAGQTLNVGPSDTVVFGSLNFYATTADASAVCWIESHSGGAFHRISQFAFFDIANLGDHVQVPLTGFDNDAPKENGQVRARCSSSGGVTFDRGDLNSLSTPQL